MPRKQTMTQKGERSDMPRKRTSHVLRASCPVTCLRRQLPLRACRSVRKHLHRRHIPHLVVRDVVQLYWHDEITTVPGLSAQGRDAIIASLKTAGLLPAALLSPRISAQERTKTLAFMRAAGYIPAKFPELVKRTPL